MSAPTKGPFTVHPQSHGCEVRGPHGVAVAWFGCATTAGRDGSYSINAAEAEANARMFVASAEMLAALRIAANDLESLHAFAASGAARAAIRKAKGEA